jgi:hypothetical protein
MYATKILDEITMNDVVAFPCAELFHGKVAYFTFKKVRTVTYVDLVNTVGEAVDAVCFAVQFQMCRE